MSTLSPNTNPTGEGTINWSANIPVSLRSRIGQEAVSEDEGQSMKEYVFKYFLEGLQQKRPDLAEEFRTLMVTHRDKAIAATREGTKRFYAASKVATAVTGSLCIAAAMFFFNLEARRTASGIQVVRNVRRYEEAA